MSSTFVRFFFSDWRVLAYLKIHRFGYVPEIAETLKRSKRAIQYTLAKLEQWNLIERHGNLRCPFQWYSINSVEKEKIYSLIRMVGGFFGLKHLKKTSYLVLDLLLFGVRRRRVRKDPGRPGGSVPYNDPKIFKRFYNFLRKYAPDHRSPHLPKVFFEKKGKKLYQVLVEYEKFCKFSRTKRDFFWIQSEG